MHLERRASGRYSHAYLNAHENRDLPIVIDTGCSLSLTPVLDDFVGPIEPSTVHEMTGVADKVKVVGIGTVEWNIRDLYGNVGIVRTRAYYVPGATIRLFSPQEYCAEEKLHPDGFRPSFRGDGEYLTLTLRTGDDLTFPYQSNNLPLMFTDETMSQPTPNVHDMAYLSKDEMMDSTMTLLRDNHNLSFKGKFILLWHYRLGHAGFAWVKSLLTPTKSEKGEDKTPSVIPHSLQGITTTPKITCPACQLGKQHRRSTGSHVHKVRPDMEAAIKREHLSPGDCVSMDQYISRVPGHLEHTFGKEKRHL